MTGNLITKLFITDSSNTILQYLLNCGIDVNRPITVKKKNEQYIESEISLEVIDGSKDPGYRTVEHDIVCTVNTNAEKLKTYSGDADWYCFDNINTLNQFVKSFYYSFNCFVDHLEYDLTDLLLCLASIPNNIRIIRSTRNLNELRKDIASLFMYRQHSRDINSVEVFDYVTLVEERLPEGAIFMASSVAPYQFVSEQLDFFYTTEKIGADFIEKVENRRFRILENQFDTFDIPECLKK